MNETYKEYICDVCENHGYCSNGSRPMITHYGLKVCSTGCAMRSWKFANLINPKYNHTVMKSVIPEGSMSCKNCECGCNEFIFFEDFDHLDCPSKHLRDDAIIDNEDKDIDFYGKKSKFKCLDCDKGLMEYQKRIIDIIRKKNNKI